MVERVIVKTDFERGGAGDLVDYIKYDRKQDKRRVPVRDHTGRDLDSEELDRFVERSAETGMERHFIISPDPEAEMPATELDRGTRRLMSDWRSSRPSVSYVYAIHDGGEKPHVHVAATGQERDLWMDRDDVTDIRHKARDAFREGERLPTKAQTQERDQDATRDLERALERDRGE